MANDCIPLFEEADRVTAHASVALTGKTCVVITGDMQSSGPGLAPDPLGDDAGGNIVVGLPALGGRIFGVAAFDAAIDDKVDVIREGIVPITAAAAINANDEVMVDATGKVLPVTTGKFAIGFAVSGAAQAAPAYIALYGAMVKAP